MTHVLTPGERRGRDELIQSTSKMNTIDALPGCTSCGHCCHLVVELVTGVDDVPSEWVVEHAGVRCMEQRGDGACVALDPVTKLCTIYERRPQVCRDFARGSGLCRQIVERRSKSHPMVPRKISLS
jgi:Fe-S-cluster containining protein